MKCCGRECWAWSLGRLRWPSVRCSRRSWAGWRLAARWLGEWRRESGDLCGAIFGTIAAGFFLLPALGLRKTIYVAAAINFLIGVFALVIDRLALAQVDQLGSVKTQADKPAEVRTQPLEPTSDSAVLIS